MTKASTLNRRLRWFDEGAAALKRTFPDAPRGIYVCPLCLGTFERDAVAANKLTDEHVPPFAIERRRPRLLSCRECNNASSSRHDAHLVKANLMNTWGSPGTAGPLPDSVMRVNGVVLRGEMSDDGTNRTFKVIPKQNNPNDFLRLVESLIEMGNGSVNGVDFSAVARHDQEAAAMSIVRAAYLAAFVTFGYKYILRDVLDPYRSMIANDDRSIIPLMRSQSVPVTARMVWPFIEAPPALRGAVGVVVGRDIVVLPGHDRVVDVLKAIAAMTPLGEQQSMVVGLHYARWPDEPLYLDDV